jgi:hypothetical protein
LKFEKQNCGFLFCHLQIFSPKNNSRLHDSSMYYFMFHDYLFGAKVAVGVCPETLHD